MTDNNCSYFGNPWIGMFVKTTDTVSLVPVDSMEKFTKKISEVLKTEIVKITIGESNLVGSYTAINNNGMIIPNIARENEIREIKKTGLNVLKSTAKFNAHGNNICTNNKCGVINPHIPEPQRKTMEDVLGVELIPMTIAKHTTVGSCVIATDNGFLAHYQASEDEVKQLEEIFKVKGNKGTVNMGTGFVSVGLAVNKNGYVAGEKTSAYELGRVEEALGFI